MAAAAVQLSAAPADVSSQPQGRCRRLYNSLSSYTLEEEGVCVCLRSKHLYLFTKFAFALVLTVAALLAVTDAFRAERAPVKEVLRESLNDVLGSEIPAVSFIVVTTQSMGLRDSTKDVLPIEHKPDFAFSYSKRVGNVKFDKAGSHLQWETVYVRPERSTLAHMPGITAVLPQVEQKPNLVRVSVSSFDLPFHDTLQLKAGANVECFNYSTVMTSQDPWAEGHTGTFIGHGASGYILESSVPSEAMQIVPKNDVDEIKYLGSADWQTCDEGSTKPSVRVPIYLNLCNMTPPFESDRYRYVQKAMSWTPVFFLIPVLAERRQEAMVDVHSAVEQVLSERNHSARLDELATVLQAEYTAGKWINSLVDVPLNVWGQQTDNLYRIGESTEMLKVSFTKCSGRCPAGELSVDLNVEREVWMPEGSKNQCFFGAAEGDEKLVYNMPGLMLQFDSLASVERDVVTHTYFDASVSILSYTNAGLSILAVLFPTTVFLTRQWWLGGRRTQYKEFLRGPHSDGYRGFLEAEQQP
eukprot:TRINITY_DN112327_c0_g1_i1.p1 TRINITY_DN112327_c0_g1~~TRINITY_DN112327_c0_g1_i1.p1  ORF type:complete len:526 (-),score=51.95 TRINITY_DN112327_c0_g1_i1:343-1920(-)